MTNERQSRYYTSHCESFVCQWTSINFKWVDGIFLLSIDFKWLDGIFPLSIDFKWVDRIFSLPIKLNGWMEYSHFPLALNGWMEYSHFLLTLNGWMEYSHIPLALNGWMEYSRFHPSIYIKWVDGLSQSQLTFKCDSELSQVDYVILSMTLHVWMEESSLPFTLNGWMELSTLPHHRNIPLYWHIPLCLTYNAYCKLSSY